MRNSTKYCVASVRDDDAGKAGAEGSAWACTTTLHAAATPRPRHLGRGWLGRRQAYACELYLVRPYRRGPGRPRKAHGQRSASHRCRKLHKDPWLLATSLPHTAGAARWVVRCHALRMKIEEGIRDTKNPRWGFGLRDARSRRAERMEVLLLLAALGTLASWWAGLAAEAHQWARHFQANTVRHRGVLSTVFVGRALLRSLRFANTRGCASGRGIPDRPTSVESGRPRSLRQAGRRGRRP